MAARPSFLKTLYGFDGVSFETENQEPQAQGNQIQQNNAQANGYVFL